MIFIDVDGTLVGSGGRVDPAVWDAAGRARDHGIHLCLSSGRPGFGLAHDYAARLDPRGWHSFQNGASVVHLADGATRSRPLPHETVGMLVERARTTGRILELYTDTAYAVESTGERARAHAALLGVPFAPRPFASLEGTIVRAQWLADAREEPVITAEAHPGLTLAESSSPVMPGIVFMNMTLAGVDKGASLREIAAAYAIPLDEVMAVGDGLNDVPAFHAAGIPVAMGNAEPGAKAVARHVVADVDAGGLVQAIELAIQGDGGHP